MQLGGTDAPPLLCAGMIKHPPIVPALVLVCVRCWDNSSAPHPGTRELFIFHQLPTNCIGKEFIAPPTNTFTASNLSGGVSE